MSSGDAETESTVYVDQLSVSSTAALARLRWAGKISSRFRVAVLDADRGSVWPATCAMMLRSIGATIERPSFFAGHLRVDGGLPARAAARQAAFQLSIELARTALSRVPALRRLNERYGRDSIHLTLSFSLVSLISDVTLRFFSAEGLRRQCGESSAIALIARAPGLAGLSLDGLAPGLEACLYRPLLPPFTSSRTFRVLWWARGLWRRLRAHLRRPQKLSSESQQRTVMVLQEDEVSLDRSYRSQPHWLDDAPNSPPFRTMILAQGNPPIAADTVRELSRRNVHVRDLDREPRSRGRDPITRGLQRDRRLSMARMVGTMSRDAGAWHFAAARLFEDAVTLSGFCQQENVRAFLVSENYMTRAHAMQVVGPLLGIKTISYQYSNLPYATTPMLTTADVMATFSDYFNSRFTSGPFRPGSFSTMGYVFDGAFDRVRDRARECRQRLEQAGARFVICFFDESMQTDRYGLIHADDYAEELLTLLGALRSDPSLGLVFKTQFHHSLTRSGTRLKDAIDDGRATGRLVLPHAGAHRNTVFPAEAAMAADIAIGHAIGGTASLEVALAGTRSLILNPYKFRTENDALYATCDIVYPSLTAAIEAIDRFRRGDAAMTRLGDWSAILPVFDAFRDGRSAERLRQLAAAAVMEA